MSDNRKRPPMPGAGRPFLEGGKPAQRITVTLPTALLAYIDQQPGRNRSEKIRALIKNQEK